MAYSPFKFLCPIAYCPLKFLSQGRILLSIFSQCTRAWPSKTPRSTAAKNLVSCGMLFVSSNKLFPLRFLFEFSTCVARSRLPGEFSPCAFICVLRFSFPLVFSTCAVLTCPQIPYSHGPTPTRLTRPARHGRTRLDKTERRISDLNRGAQPDWKSPDFSRRNPRPDPTRADLTKPDPARCNFFDMIQEARPSRPDSTLPDWTRPDPFRPDPTWLSRAAVSFPMMSWGPVRSNPIRPGPTRPGSVFRCGPEAPPPNRTAVIFPIGSGAWPHPT